MSRISVELEENGNNVACLASLDYRQCMERAYQR
jgi:hypothetical protein